MPAAPDRFTADPRIPRRLLALDGLRGIAAVVVVLHHAFLTVPALAAAYFPEGPRAAVGSIAWWVTYTPLHLVWMGTEAVAVFFLLSGIVLVLPVVRSTAFDWFAYYPRRIVRLYGPVLAAIAFGLLTMVVVPRYDDPVLGAWLHDLPDVYSIKGLAKDATLVAGTSGSVSTLWSLQWEVWFSLLLPAIVWFAVRTRRAAWLSAAGLLGLVALGSAVDSPALVHLPIFGLGAIVVVQWGWLADLAERVSPMRWFWPVVLVVGLLLAAARWEVGGLGGDTFPADRFAAISVGGACLVVLVAAFWRPAARFLETPVVQYLGRVSFSLYLVHEPIVISTRTLLADWSPWGAMLVSVPLSVGIAHLFMRFVETAFHRLAGRVGRRVEGRATKRRRALA